MKIKYRDNFRVVVEPRSLGHLGYVKVSDSLVEPDTAKRRKEYEGICNDILADIKRHVNSVGYASVESDEVSLCGFCGSKWSEDGTEYNGGCCAKDIENEPKENT